LNPASIEVLIRSGINDFGGISPVTPDYINPDHPWPNISSLAEVCAREGFVLRPRLPVYPHYLEREGFVHPRLRAPIEAAQARLS
jgi:FO synthase